MTRNGKILKNYCKWLDAKDLTIENYRRILVRFGTLTGKDLLNVAPDDIHLYLSKMKKAGASNRTRLHSLKCLRSLYRYLASYNSNLTPKEKDIAKGIFTCLRDRERFNIKPEEDKPIYCPKEDEVYRMINATTNLRDRVLLSLLASTGARNAEILSILRSDIDLENSTIRILGKGVGLGKERVVSFSNGKTKEYFKEYLKACGAKDNERIFKLKPFDLRKIVKQTAKRAKIKAWASIHPHIFRHWFATTLLERGLPDSQVMLLTGHKSRKVFERYLHVKIDREKYQQANLLGGL